MLICLAPFEPYLLNRHSRQPMLTQRQRDYRFDCNLRFRPIEPIEPLLAVGTPALGVGTPGVIPPLLDVGDVLGFEPLPVGAGIGTVGSMAGATGTGGIGIVGRGRGANGTGGIGIVGSIAGARGTGARGMGARGNGARGTGARGIGARGTGARGTGARGTGARGTGAKTGRLVRGGRVGRGPVGGMLERSSSCKTSMSPDSGPDSGAGSNT